MKILITGVHGFVGTNLVNALKTENEIYGLDIINPKKDGVIKTYSWNELDCGAVEPVDAVIHLAGKAHDLKKTAGAEDYFRINTDLTKKIFDWFLMSGAQKFIFFSSVKAAADFVPGDILTEEVEPKPVGPYGESKIKAEEYILNHMDSKRDIYILRPCMIHGPGNKGNLNLLYGVVKKGIPWPLGAYDNKRCFTSIDNLIYVIKGMLCKKVASGIYNMCDDEPLSTNELVEVISQALGKKAHILNLPKGLMNFLSQVGDVLHLPLNSERITKLTENYVVSNMKIKKALGVVEMPVRAKDGLVKTIKSFINQ